MLVGERRAGEVVRLLGRHAAGRAVVSAAGCRDDRTAGIAMGTPAPVVAACTPSPCVRPAGATSGPSLVKVEVDCGPVNAVGRVPSTSCGKLCGRPVRNAEPCCGLPVGSAVESHRTHVRMHVLASNVAVHWVWTASFLPACPVAFAHGRARRRGPAVRAAPTDGDGVPRERPGRGVCPGSVQ